MNIGYIYKITNLINGKVYIGQTSKTIQERWRHHKMDSINEYKETYNCPLYRAFRKYGIDNFNIKEVEKCEVEQLNEREIYWISFYDSYHNGYNATLGGDGKRTLELNETDVINKYNETKNLLSTAIFFNCSRSSIKEILLKNNIEIISAIKHAKEKGIYIKRIDILSGEVLGTYETLHDAGQWVLDNNLSNAKNNKNCAIGIRYAIIKDSFAYGFKWICDDETLEKLKNSLSSKNKNIYKRVIKKSFKICPICGNNMDSKSDMCITCFNNKKKEDSFKDLELKISKEILKQIVRKKSFLQISKEYNVSDNTIKKWCQKYLIPYRKEDINKISDKDWEKECNLTKEEYDIKYCQPKEKKVYSDEEIIEYYKEFKSLKAVVIKCHRDRETIKNILINNGIDISRENQKDINFQRLDKDSLEILEIYTYLDDVVNWVHNNINSKVKRTSIQASINKACRNNGNLYGYKWRKIR